MNAFAGLGRAGQWTLRKLLGSWVRVTIKPEDAAAAVNASPRPVCYVLERESSTDLAVLDILARRLALPRPARRLALGRGRNEEACFPLLCRPRLFGCGSSTRAPRFLIRAVDAAVADARVDMDFVPVAIYWGRAPHKEASLWRLFFTEDRVIVGRFRKLLNVLVNGRNTLVYFGTPVRLRDALDSAGSSAPRGVRRILRTLRAELRAQRDSSIGPDLSHRRTLVAQLMRTQAVRRAVRRDMAGRTARSRVPPRRAALIQARRHAIEIAANYSHPFIRFMSVVLGRLWNWLYDGVEFEHVEKLSEIGDGAEIIYVPCHRSHMDYLLLSYVIYRKGFAVPHVAAGINLNLPLIGRFLRKGGAFFLRRSFKGDPLYAAVFAKYLGFMMARGHPLEYFIEGGRSRTGRLLTPRTGMLAMTVREYLRDPNRPVVFMPVYFGYERVVEGRTYIGELSGRPKEKESLLGLIKAAFAVLRSRLGTVHVNLGEPIALDALLGQANPAWREQGAGPEEPMPAWVGAAVGTLATRIATGINSAAAVTPINLVAMAILATPRQALPEAALIGQLELYRDLLRDVPYSPLVTVTAASGMEMIHYAQGMGVLQRQTHPLGDILRMDAQSAVLATYVRNNVLHLFALPSLLACCFVSNSSMRTADLQRLVWRVYPYIAAELFLRWDETQVDVEVKRLLRAFVELGLLEVEASGEADGEIEGEGEWRRPIPNSPQALRLSLLAEATIQTIERYYLVIALLLQAGSGSVTQEALEERCTLMAQRMATLYGLDSPEFFDRSLFRNFIDLLRERGVVLAAPGGPLEFGEPLHGVAADARWVLSEQIRHSILQVTLGQ